MHALWVLLRFTPLLVVLALCLVPTEGEPVSGLSVKWEERAGREVVVQVTEDVERKLMITIAPAYLYQKVRWTTLDADGRLVRLEQWQAMDYPLAHPATGWGLRNEEALRKHYRETYGDYSRKHQTLTLLQGPTGWLVNVKTTYPKPGETTPSGPVTNSTSGEQCSPSP